MKENFDKAFLWTVGAEGKPTNDPDDPGGFTIWGLAKRYHPEVDEHTSLEYAKEVYRKQYWNACGCDDLPAGLDIAAFDYAVTSAPADALAVLKRTKNWQDFMIFRLKHYAAVVQKDPVKKKYFLGWANRVTALWDYIKKG